MPDLVKGFENDAGHVALVIFIGAEHVEKLDARHLIFQLVPQNPQIENLLGVAVHVDRSEFRNFCVLVGKSLRSVAVRRGGTGVDEADIVIQRPFGERPRVGKIILPQVVRVALGRRRAGAHVNNGADLKRHVVIANHLEEIVLTEVVFKP